MTAHQIALVTTMLFIATSAGIVGGAFAAKASSITTQLRRILAYSSSIALLASVAVYIHQMQLAFKLPDSVSFIERLHILLPAERIGSWMNDGALVASLFAAGRARTVLMVGNVVLLVLWWGVFVGV